MRTFDSGRVNYLVNHPAVRPTCGGEGFLDCTPSVENADNIYLNGEHGGLAFIWSAPRVYEVHVFLLPEGRGKWGFDFGMDGRDYMAAYADMLWARIDRPALRYFTMKAGFKPCGKNTIDIGQGPVTYDLYKWEY